MKAKVLSTLTEVREIHDTEKPTFNPKHKGDEKKEAAHRKLMREWRKAEDEERIYPIQFPTNEDEADDLRVELFSGKVVDIKVVKGRAVIQ